MVDTSAGYCALGLSSLPRLTDHRVNFERLPKLARSLQGMMPRTRVLSSPAYPCLTAS